jgi:hypothetical protein
VWHARRAATHCGGRAERGNIMRIGAYAVLICAARVDSAMQNAPPAATAPGLHRCRPGLSGLRRAGTESVTTLEWTPSAELDVIVSRDKAEMEGEKEFTEKRSRRLFPTKRWSRHAGSCFVSPRLWLTQKQPPGVAHNEAVLP